jgi:hypothetical protein
VAVSVRKKRIAKAKVLSVLPFGFTSPSLSPGRCEFMAECAVAVLNRRRHSPGVKLLLDGDCEDQFELRWEADDENLVASFADTQEATEHAAYAIAILVMSKIVPNCVVERAAKGLGFDFWVGEGQHELPFQGLARLEVSGILRGSNSEINRRVNVKRNQMQVSDGLGKGYVAVIEFGTPVARVEWNNPQ